MLRLISTKQTSPFVPQIDSYGQACSLQNQKWQHGVEFSARDFFVDLGALLLSVLIH